MLIYMMISTITMNTILWSLAGILTSTPMNHALMFIRIRRIFIIAISIAKK